MPNNNQAPNISNFRHYLNTIIAQLQRFQAPTDKLPTDNLSETNETLPNTSDKSDNKNPSSETPEQDFEGTSENSTTQELQILKEAIFLLNELLNSQNYTEFDMMETIGPFSHYLDSHSQEPNLSSETSEQDTLKTKKAPELNQSTNTTSTKVASVVEATTDVGNMQKEEETSRLTIETPNKNTEKQVAASDKQVANGR